jgi:hypothetical protein
MPRISAFNPKSGDHRRTPKRERSSRVRNNGHVLDCGSPRRLLPLLIEPETARSIFIRANAD